MAKRAIGYLRRHAVAYLALFIALGGTSYAVSSLPANSVGTRQIRDNAVTSDKLRRGAVRADDVGRLPGVNAFTAEPEQQLADGTFTPIPLRQEAFDVGDMHDTEGDTTRVVIPRRGTYVVQGTASFSGGPCGGPPRAVLIQRHFRTGGSVEVDHVNSGTMCNELTRLHAGAVVRLGEGDSLQLLALQRGSGQTTAAGRLSVAYVGG